MHVMLDMYLLQEMNCPKWEKRGGAGQGRAGQSGAGQGGAGQSKKSVDIGIGRLKARAVYLQLYTGTYCMMR